MDAEPNVTLLPGVSRDSWSAGSVASDPLKHPGRRGRSGKGVALGMVALLVLAGLAFGSYRVGASHGDKAGHERGLAAGYASGHDEGFSEGRTEGYSSGREAGYDEGTEDGYATGYSSGKKAGYADGYTDGSSGGYGQGWTAGCLAVFTALGDDTAAAWSDVDGFYDSTYASTVSRLSCY
jgi:hypothetical protein